jgi:hypothetical protein
MLAIIVYVSSRTIFKIYAVEFCMTLAWSLRQININVTRTIRKPAKLQTEWRLPCLVCQKFGSTFWPGVRRKKYWLLHRAYSAGAALRRKHDIDNKWWICCAHIDQGSLLGQYTGYTVPDDIIVTPSNVSFVRFRTDDIVTDYGFVLNFTTGTPADWFVKLPPIVYFLHRFIREWICVLLQSALCLCF